MKALKNTEYCQPQVVSMPVWCRRWLSYSPFFHQSTDPLPIGRDSLPSRTPKPIPSVPRAPCPFSDTDDSSQGGWFRCRPGAGGFLNLEWVSPLKRSCLSAQLFMSEPFQLGCLLTPHPRSAIIMEAGADNIRRREYFFEIFLFFFCRCL